MAEGIKKKIKYDMLAHDRALYRKVFGEYSFRAKNRTGANIWQKRFRSALREALGVSRMEKDLSGHRLHAQKQATADRGFYVEEKWLLWTEPGVPQPFWLLRPPGPARPRPLVLTPHGHETGEHYLGIGRTRADMRLIRDEQRDVAVQAVMEGYMAILPTVRGFGDTKGREDAKWGNLSSCRSRLMHGLLLGRTPIWERVWDIGMLLDWALERKDIDRTRVAITGNSGGGTVSLFASACDTRISVAVPASYFSTFAGSIGSIWHCDCNYIPGLLRLGEMADVAGLIAPRPFCAINGKKDDIYPLAEAKKSYARLRAIYRVFRAGDQCRLYVGNGGHRYYSEGCWPFVRKIFGRG